MFILTDQENIQPEDDMKMHIPSFMCEAYIKGSIENFSLDSYINKWTIFIFTSIDLENYQNEDYFGSIRNLLIIIEENITFFEKKGIEVIIILPETKNYIKDFAETSRNEGGLGGFSFPMISDINATLSNLFGVKSALDGFNIIVADDEKCLKDKRFFEIQNIPYIDDLLQLVESNRKTK